MRPNKRGVSGEVATQSSSNNKSNPDPSSSCQSNTSSTRNRSSGSNRLVPKGNRSNTSTSRKGRAQVVAASSTPVTGAEVLLVLPDGSAVPATITSCIPVPASSLQSLGFSQDVLCQQQPATLLAPASPGSSPHGSTTVGDSTTVPVLSISTTTAGDSTPLPTLCISSTTPWDEAVSDVQVTIPLPKAWSRYKVAVRRRSQGSGTPTGAQHAVPSAEGSSMSHAGAEVTAAAAPAPAGMTGCVVDDPTTAVSRLLASRLPWRHIAAHVPEVKSRCIRDGCHDVCVKLSEIVNDASLDVARAAIKLWKADGRQVPEGLGAAIKGFGMATKAVKQMQQLMGSRKALKSESTNNGSSGTGAKAGKKSQKLGTRSVHSGSQVPPHKDGCQAAPCNDQAAPSSQQDQQAPLDGDAALCEAGKVSEVDSVQRGCYLEQLMQAWEHPTVQSSRDVLLSLLCCITDSGWVTTTLADKSSTAVMEWLQPPLDSAKGSQDEGAGSTTKQQPSNQTQPAAAETNGVAEQHAHMLSSASEADAAADTSSDSSAFAPAPVPRYIANLLQRSSIEVCCSVWTLMHVALYEGLQDAIEHLVTLNSGQQCEAVDAITEAMQHVDAVVSDMMLDSNWGSIDGMAQQALLKGHTADSKAGNSKADSKAGNAAAGNTAAASRKAAAGSASLLYGSVDEGQGAASPVLFDITWATPELQTQLASTAFVSFCLAVNKLISTWSEWSDDASMDVSAMVASQAYSSRLWQMGLRWDVQDTAKGQDDMHAGAAATGAQQQQGVLQTVASSVHHGGLQNAAGIITASPANGKRRRKWHSKHQQAVQGSEVVSSTVRPFRSAWFHANTRQGDDAPDAALAREGKEDAVALAAAATAATEALRLQARNGKHISKHAHSRLAAKHQPDSNGHTVSSQPDSNGPLLGTVSSQPCIGDVAPHKAPDTAYEDGSLRNCDSADCSLCKGAPHPAVATSPATGDAGTVAQQATASAAAAAVQAATTDAPAVQADTTDAPAVQADTTDAFAVQAAATDAPAVQAATMYAPAGMVHKTSLASPTVPAVLMSTTEGSFMQATIFPPVATVSSSSIQPSDQVSEAVHCKEEQSSAEEAVKEGVRDPGQSCSGLGPAHAAGGADGGTGTSAEASNGMRVGLQRHGKECVQAGSPPKGQAPSERPLLPAAIRTTDALPRTCVNSTQADHDARSSVCFSTWQVLLPNAGHNILLHNPNTNQHAPAFLPSLMSRTFTLDRHTPVTKPCPVLYNAELYKALLHPQDTHACNRVSSSTI